MTNRFGVALAVILATLAAPALALAADDPPPEAAAEATAQPESTPPPVEPSADPESQPKWGLAVGLGWNFPADLGTPNTASLRIRKGSFTLEPAVAVTASGSWNKDSADGEDAVDRVGGWSATLGLGARRTMATRQRVSLVGILVPSATITDGQSNPEGTDNAVRSTSLGFTAAWGLGVEYRPVSEWSVSLDATSDLAAVTWARTYEMESNLAQQDTAYTAGLTLLPKVRAMAHLHF